MFLQYIYYLKDINDKKVKLIQYLKTNSKQ